MLELRFRDEAISNVRLILVELLEYLVSERKISDSLLLNCSDTEVIKL